MTVSDGVPVEPASLTLPPISCPPEQLSASAPTKRKADSDPVESVKNDHINNHKKPEKVLLSKPLISETSPISEGDHIRLEGLLHAAQDRASQDRLSNEAAALQHQSEGGKVMMAKDGKKKGYWRQRTYDDAPPQSANEQTPSASETIVPSSALLEPKKPKRKVALLMGYSGTGYLGMQMNPNANTIELELFKALAMSGAVSNDNAMDAYKMSFMRCARTDKGVHAAGQVVSLKMCIEDEDIIDRINSYLPAQIRTWGFVRTINQFHAKNGCDSRVYEYLLPTYVLVPCEDWNSPGGRSDIERAKLMEKSTLEELAERRSYRITPDRLAQLQEILSTYVGSFNYHNFTVGRPYKDPSVTRHIKSFKCGEPFVREEDGIEWISCKVHGQAFMLHQIRKMIGLAVLMVRSGTPVSLIPRTFGSIKLNIPRAPALGLLLDRCVFESYNASLAFRGAPKKGSASGSKLDLPPITFDPHTKVIEEFKAKWIYSQLMEDESKHGHFDEWVRSVAYRMEDYSWFLDGSKGEIHEERKPAYFQTTAKDGIAALDQGEEEAEESVKALGEE